MTTDVRYWRRGAIEIVRFPPGVTDPQPSHLYTEVVVMTLAELTEREAKAWGKGYLRGQVEHCDAIDCEIADVENPYRSTESED